MAGSLARRRGSFSFQDFRSCKIFRCRTCHATNTPQEPHLAAPLTIKVLDWSQTDPESLKSVEKQAKASSIMADDEKMKQVRSNRRSTDRVVGLAVSTSSESSRLASPRICLTIVSFRQSQLLEEWDEKDADAGTFKRTPIHCRRRDSPSMS